MNYTDKNKRPNPIKPKLDSVPAELKTIKQWVLWKYVWKNDQWAKIPFATNGSTAATNNPHTWSTFESVLITYEQGMSHYDGIGFVFTKETDFVGVDLDNCLKYETELTPFAARVIEKLQTYTEVSPSGTGIHLIGKANEIEALKTKFKDNEIEIYRTGRYFTFTGWSLIPQLPVRDIHADLTEIVNAVRPPERKTETKHAETPLNLNNETRLKMALKNERTKRWFDGDTSDFGGDDSRADLALTRSLAFFSDGNRDILDWMFRQSKLMRPKWDERRGNDTYGNITMQKVLATQEHYASFVNLKKEPSNFDSRKARRLSVNDMWDLVMDYRQSGEAQGVKCGWENLSRLYRPAKRQVTVVTGLPGSGKSTLLDVYCYQLAKLHGWKFTFASFETLPLERHILNFAQIATMKPSFTFVQNHASDAEMEEAREFLNEHFFFLKPADEDFTMDAILQYVADDIKERQIDGFVLDTFTELDEQQERGETETQLIKRVLKKQQRFTRQNDIHSWIVAHPSKSKEHYINGRPSLGSIGGSQNFWNKIDFGIVVDRPDKSNNITKVYVDKVRFDINGQEGECEFTYDRDARFYTPYNQFVASEANWNF